MTFLLLEDLAEVSVQTEKRGGHSSMGQKLIYHRCISYGANKKAKFLLKFSRKGKNSQNLSVFIQHEKVIYIWWTFMRREHFYTGNKIYVEGLFVWRTFT